MGLILKQIFAFIRLLHSEADTRPMAAGIALGAILGFAPLLSLQAFFVFLVLIVFRIQFGAALVSAFFFKFLAWLIDGPADALGRLVLESEGLRPFFVKIYNLPFLPMTRFNNSIVMGSMIISIVLSVPLYFLFCRLIDQYRNTVVVRIKNTKLWKAIAATKFYGLYLKYLDIRGAA